MPDQLALVSPQEVLERLDRLLAVAARATELERNDADYIHAQVDSAPGDPRALELAFAALRGCLNRLGDVGECRGCRATVWWVPTINGRRAPYSAGGLNHFADCPKAGQFRRRPRPGA